MPRALLSSCGDVRKAVLEGLEPSGSYSGLREEWGTERATRRRTSLGNQPSTPTCRVEDSARVSDTPPRGILLKLIGVEIGRPLW